MLQRALQQLPGRHLQQAAESLVDRQQPAPGIQQGHALGSQLEGLEKVALALVQGQQQAGLALLGVQRQADQAADRQGHAPAE